MSKNTVSMNFRLYQTDKNRLDSLVASLNEGKEGRRITQADIIRALLKIGEETQKKDFLQKIQEIF